MDKKNKIIWDEREKNDSDLRAMFTINKETPTGQKVLTVDVHLEGKKKSWKGGLALYD